MATRYRLAVSAPLEAGAQLVLEGNAAHYLGHVLRLQVGAQVGVFNRVDGEWAAQIQEIRKREVVLRLGAQLRTRAPDAPQLMVCFAPIKGGRLETIIEKATELGATVLQPVITQRTIVDRVNLERAEALVREAAEQCERVDWPEIREPVRLPALLGAWPEHVPLVYGDESGAAVPFSELVGDCSLPSRGMRDRFAGSNRGVGPLLDSGQRVNDGPLLTSPFEGEGQGWGILVGPEGGFTPEEFALLKRVEAAKGVSLGPRILRADTAVITLSALTMAVWGDWHQRPRFAR